MASSISSTPSTTQSTATATPTPTSTASTVISSTGIGSGLDINSIVSSLTTAAGLAQNNQLSDRKTALTAQVSAYGTFSAALDTLQATLTTLTDPKTLAGRTVTLGDDKIASATATSGAIPAQYSLQVQPRDRRQSRLAAAALGRHGRGHGNIEYCGGRLIRLDHHRFDR
jgi:flagellar capping protein FliD